MTLVDQVSEVVFYPIKGCHAATVNGEVPQSLTVGATGFEVNGVRDRDWVLYDPNERSFVSQRGWGSQGQRVRYPDDRQLATVSLDVCENHVVVSSSLGGLELPTAPIDGAQRTLDIFGKQLPVVEQSSEASKYFSRLLGREVLLMRSDRNESRMLPERYQREGAFNQVAGADGMPFLLVNEASLVAAYKANNMEDGTVPINRYRGNIIIGGNTEDTEESENSGTGLGAFGEDYIDGEARFSIGDIGMWVVKACSRCPVPDIDQETGERVGGALRVLRGRAGTIFTGETGVFFGQNVVHANVGAISVDDVVMVDHFSTVPNIDFRAARA